jgi:hypothetical protein
MIKQIVIIVDEYDANAAADVEDVLNGIENLEGTSVIITDEIKTAINALELTTEIGVIH